METSNLFYSILSAVFVIAAIVAGMLIGGSAKARYHLGKKEKLRGRKTLEGQGINNSGETVCACLAERCPWTKQNHTYLP